MGVDPKGWTPVSVHLTVSLPKAANSLWTSDRHRTLCRVSLTKFRFLFFPIELLDLVNGALSFQASLTASGSQCRKLNTGPCCCRNPQRTRGGRSIVSGVMLSSAMPAQDSEGRGVTCCLLTGAALRDSGD